MTDHGSQQFEDYGGFFKHKSREGYGAFLGNWKKETGQVDVWLHTKCPPVALWRHQFYKIEAKEEKETREITRQVWSNNLNCFEREDVLKKQYKLDDNDNRLLPPRICPACRLIDWVRNAVLDNVISWTTPVFKFEGTDPKKNVILHAGGMYGGFGGDLTPAEKAELASHGIYQKEAWKENMMAKLSYVFAVVTTNEIGKGVQIAIENALLGDKIKGVVNDKMLELGEEEGDPSVKPYAFRWMYRKDEPEFGKKYHVVAMRRLPLTPEIEELIRGPAPDIKRIAEPFDVATARATWERHCLLPNVPWDAIFEGHDTTQKEPEPARTEVAPAQIASAGAATVADPAMVACDVCKHLMHETEATCGKCGTTYDLATGAIVARGTKHLAPPPAQPRARSAVAPAAPPASTPAPAAQRPTARGAGPTGRRAPTPPGPPDDDDIPF